MSRFLCDPVKYKQLYKWEANTLFGGNFWRPRCRSNFLNLEIQRLDRAGKYSAGFYIAPCWYPNEQTEAELTGTRDDLPARWRMMGPYPDLPTAKSVAEVFITLRQAPRWVWKRPKKEKR